MDTAALTALMAKTKANLKKSEKTVKLGPGKNRIRLLPGWRKGEEHLFFHNYGKHFIKDAAETLQAVYLCNNVTHGAECKVCSALAIAGRAAGDDVTLNLLAECKPTRKVVINALMLDSAEPNTPVPLELSTSTFEQLVDIVQAWGASVLDPAAGQEIQISREGKGLNTTYTVTILPAVYKVPPAALAKLTNLDEFSKEEGDEQLHRAIAAINDIAGIMPAGSGRDVPATTRLPVSSAGSSDFADVLEEVNADMAKGGTDKVKANIALDSELDDLLSDLPD